jgi:hypothetical protein
MTDPYLREAFWACVILVGAIVGVYLWSIP